MTQPATTFESFLRAYQNMVFSTAIRLLGNENEAKDIAQEVFLKAHARFDMLCNNPAAGGWLKKVTTNLCLNHLTRYRMRWKFFSEMVSEDTTCQFEELLASEDLTHQGEELEHRRHYLELALQKLPPAQRVPLVLYHFEDMSYESIADQLKISLSKVKTDIHRGRQALRRWLSPDMDAWDQARSTQSNPRKQAPQDCVILPWVLGGEAY